MKPIEVAVIGGGCAAITTAFELTRPEHKGRYNVTVYQLGWRLGGKGASGRGPADRIEEHGLHIWLGFYENAFRLLRECYAELGRDPATCRIASWRDAFFAEPHVGVTERRHGAWQTWMALFPPLPGVPGDPFTDSNPFDIASYLTSATALLRALLRSAHSAGANAHTSSHSDELSWWPEPMSLTAWSRHVQRFLRYGQMASLTSVIEAIESVAVFFQSVQREMSLSACGPTGMATGTAPSMTTDLQGLGTDIVLRILDAVRAQAMSALESMMATEPEFQRIWEIVDLVVAVIRGCVASGVLLDHRGLDALDDFELREWLQRHGASARALDCAFVRGFYDLAFAYRGGDRRRPALAASSAIRGFLRMFFTYRGAFFWKMRAGMGDVVFAPFYEVLKRRGVTFRFFHRLEKVELVDPQTLAPGERPYVTALEFDVQAEIVGGGEYQPLVDVRGLPCWPAEPDYAQLVHGERLCAQGWDFESFWDRRKAGQKTLRVSTDFDLVVLGVGLGAVAHVCREFVSRDRRWRDMVANVETVATQAFQLWLNPTLGELGWNHPQSSISGYIGPFDTWADMRHLIAEESWPARVATPEGADPAEKAAKKEPQKTAPEVPGSIIYFCNVLESPRALPDRGELAYPAFMRERVRRNAIEFLTRDIHHMWPKVRTGQSPEFPWHFLISPYGPAHDTAAGTGAERFATQFWTANVNPSDLYVQAAPGTARYRISPLDNSYDNLTIAGDWTACGLNSGCVEAAVMAGRLAAHAIAHVPPLEDIVGYDHP